MSACSGSWRNCWSRINNCGNDTPALRQGMPAIIAIIKVGPEAFIRVYKEVTVDLADRHEAARIERQADVAQLVEQLIRNQ
jgi:hypothetical protein